MTWAAGSQCLTRFVRLNGTVAFAAPLRVVADDGAELLGWLPAGTPVLQSRLLDGRHPRELPLDGLFTAPRRLVRQEWQRTSTLRWIPAEGWSSVFWFFESDGRFRNWYVNLEVPGRRWEHGVDRTDGVLDIVVRPDRSWEWKDEHELAPAMAAGRITADHLARLRAEGERMLSLVRAGEFPFDGSYQDFRPNPGWSELTLDDDLAAQPPGRLPPHPG